MPQIVPAAGKAVVDLGAWVTATGNPAYAQLIETYAAQLQANQVITDPAFQAMVNQFLAITNQTISV